MNTLRAIGQAALNILRPVCTTVALVALLIVAIAVLPMLATAQAPQYGQDQPHVFYAINYATSKIQGQTPNTYTWNLGTTGPGSCFSPVNQAGTQPFFVFGPTAHPFPQWIQDDNTTLSEVVTPSSTTITGSTCGFSAATSNSHTTFWVASGTGGLYEAIYANQKAPYPVTITVDAFWKNYIASLPTATTLGQLIVGIPAAFGTANIQIVDTTTVPYTTYAWNGQQYFANGGATPSIAAGAALGTGPTGLTITGNGAAGVISVTAGTSTATGTMFTLTFASGTTSTGFNHSPTCTIASLGANTPAGTLAAGSVGGSAAAGFTQPFTVSTSALTASTFYSFSYSCK